MAAATSRPNSSSSAVYEISNTFSTIKRPLDGVGDAHTILNNCECAINYVALHFLVVIATVASLIVTTSLVLVHLGYLHDPLPGCNATSGEDDVICWRCSSINPSNPFKLVHTILYFVEVGLLSLFLLEIIVRTVLQRRKIVDDKWQIFDGLVVIATFVAYITMTTVSNDSTTTTVAYLLTYSIALRLWRLGRLYRDNREYSKRCHIAECDVIQLQNELYELKVKIDQQHKSTADLQVSPLRRPEYEHDVTATAVVCQEMLRQMAPSSITGVNMSAKTPHRRGATLPQGPKYESPKQRSAAVARGAVQPISTLTPVELARPHHDDHRIHPPPQKAHPVDETKTKSVGTTFGQDDNLSPMSGGEKRRSRRRRQKQQRDDSTSIRCEKKSHDEEKTALPADALDADGDDDHTTTLRDEVGNGTTPTFDSDDDGVEDEQDISVKEADDGSNEEDEDGEEDEEEEGGDEEIDCEEDEKSSISIDDAVGDSWRSDRHSSNYRGDDGVPDVLRCYSNTAYVTENDYTEEQLREIDRVARVPFMPYDQTGDGDDESIPVTTL